VVAQISAIKATLPAGTRMQESPWFQKNGCREGVTAPAFHPAHSLLSKASNCRYSAKQHASDPLHAWGNLRAISGRFLAALGQVPGWPRRPHHPKCCLRGLSAEQDGVTPTFLDITGVAAHSKSVDACFGALELQERGRQPSDQTSVRHLPP
jgi:hypothetical protein